MVWGEDNRTCAFRVVGHGKGMRLESRLPGGDCNPYLAFAAIIAMGLEGIDRGLELEPAFAGNAYDVRRPPRPRQPARGDPPARGLGVRPQRVRRRRRRPLPQRRPAEQQAFESAVTDWELHRSFERM